jgi:hypothetical protein
MIGSAFFHSTNDPVCADAAWVKKEARPILAFACLAFITKSFGTNSLRLSVASEKLRQDLAITIGRSATHPEILTNNWGLNWAWDLPLVGESYPSLQIANLGCRGGIVKRLFSLAKQP